MESYFRVLLIQLFLFIIFFSSVAAQAPDQQLIVRWEQKTTAVAPQLAGISARQWLSTELDIELLTFANFPLTDLALEKLTHCTCVRALERNRDIDFRTEPNDPEFGEQQDNFTRAGYTDAWQLTPGGRTSDNQEIVVAILDAGFDVTHEDLSDNLWINPAELPSDGVDNDGNGYIDDRFGWNMRGGEPDFPPNAHGTQVIGLLGAKGNNGLGISGTNWDLKMMLLSIQTTAHIIEAYEYILEQRRRYNRSNGEEGAFIVATNASFGVEGATCADFEVWGSLYDELGREGILTAASTANRNWDVDMFGDMPTDCPSDYLISVANLGENDLLWRSSGFGRESIDLGAPGEGSFSTRPGNLYAPFGSTSAAAPYVTGAIALLYATPCPALLEQSKRDPGRAALLIRSVLLAGTKENSSLAFRTTTGGALDVAEAQRRLAQNCEVGTPEAFTISRASPNPTADFVVLTTNAIVFGDGGRIDLYDASGRFVRSQPAERLGSNPIALRADLRGLAAGVYLVRVTERDRVALTQVIKQ